MENYFPKRQVFYPPGEQLSKRIGDKAASDIEERTARAISKLPEWKFTFRTRITAVARNLTQTMLNRPGEVEIDFVAFNGERIVAILVDGEIAHFKTFWQAEQDAVKTVVIGQVMASLGGTVVRIPSRKEDLWRLSKQEYADTLLREVLERPVSVFELEPLTVMEQKLRRATEWLQEHHVVTASQGEQHYGR